MFNMMTIGKKAVTAAEKQLEVTSHNISNVDTPGYSRQRLLQEASMHIKDNNHNYGTGVDMIRIERMRDMQLDVEYRRFNGDSGYWGSMSYNLTQLEKSILETSEFGINAYINVFFDKWESLSDNPYSTIHRMDVVDATRNLIYGFQDQYKHIENKIDDVKTQLKQAADRINQIGEDLSKLLNHISLDTHENRPANDLLDKFDLLLDELSYYGDVKVEHRANGTTSIYLGTDELCRNDHFNKLIVEDRVHSMSGEPIFHIGWQSLGTQIAGLHTGSINALMDLKDVVLPGYLKALDEMAVTLVQQVNAIHVQGKNIIDPAHGGCDFFNPNCTGVRSLALSNEVLVDPDFIATSLTGASGDNQIALMITDLRLAQVFKGMTLTENFAEYIYNIASDIRMSNQSSERSDMLTAQSDKFRESVKGVSINEETANLVRYQRTYQAASKIISIADDVLKTIIGLVR
jgi:flagellar hook-associated protein 1 FlgK